MLVSLRFPNLSDDLFRKLARKYLKEHKYDSLQMSDFKNEHEYLLLDTTCSSQFTVSLEFHPRETASFSEQKMSADKYHIIAPNRRYCLYIQCIHINTSFAIIIMFRTVYPVLPIPYLQPLVS